MRGGGRGVLVAASVAARRIGVTVRTVRRWIASGAIEGKRIKAYRDGRARWFVTRAALDALLA